MGGYMRKHGLITWWREKKDAVAQHVCNGVRIWGCPFPLTDTPIQTTVAPCGLFHKLPSAGIGSGTLKLKLNIPNGDNRRWLGCSLKLPKSPKGGDAMNGLEQAILEKFDRDGRVLVWMG